MINSQFEYYDSKGMPTTKPALVKDNQADVGGLEVLSKALLIKIKIDWNFNFDKSAYIDLFTLSELAEEDDQHVPVPDTEFI